MPLVLQTFSHKPKYWKDISIFGQQSVQWTFHFKPKMATSWWRQRQIKSDDHQSQQDSPSVENKRLQKIDNPSNICQSGPKEPPLNLPQNSTAGTDPNCFQLITLMYLYLRITGFHTSSSFKVDFINESFFFALTFKSGPSKCSASFNINSCPLLLCEYEFGASR